MTELGVVEQKFALSYIECSDTGVDGILQYICHYPHILVDAEVSDMSRASDRMDFAGLANQLCFIPEVPLTVSQGISIFKAMIRNPGYYDVPDYRSSVGSVRQNERQYQIVLIITGNR
jgi:hypothetical protein